MLYKNKILYFLLLIIFTSCGRSENYQEEGSYFEIEQEIYDKSSQIVSANVYKEVYQLGNDSIRFWVANNLSTYLSERLNEWKLDSIICFNESGDKCVMAICKRSTFFKDQIGDGLTYFYGVKIKKEWYFFKGPYIAIPRKAYQEATHSPLPFSKLHKIAMDNIFKGYLKKNKESRKWEINDNFFARFYERDAYNYPFTTQEAWEESWLKLMRENWEKRDTTNYKPLQ